MEEYTFTEQEIRDAMANIDFDGPDINDVIEELRRIKIIIVRPPVK
jgi:SOS response regulatory protein OraA/RecX